MKTLSFAVLYAVVCISLIVVAFSSQTGYTITTDGSNIMTYSREVYLIEAITFFVPSKLFLYLFLKKRSVKIGKYIFLLVLATGLILSLNYILFNSVVNDIKSTIAVDSQVEIIDTSGHFNNLILPNVILGSLVQLSVTVLLVCELFKKAKMNSELSVS